MKRLLTLSLLVILLATPLWAQSYTPTVGVKLNVAGGTDVIIPARYGQEDGTLLPFGYATTPGGTCTVGIPTTGTTFYECDFANSAGAFGGHAQSTFPRFGTPLMIVKVAATATPGSKWDLCYSTIKCISEDNMYLVVETDGNTDIVCFTTDCGTVGARVAGFTFGVISTSPSGEFRWMRGAHKEKLLYKEGSNLFVYDVPLAMWCTALSADGLSDTCASGSETAYHTNPFGGFSIGGNEGDISAGNILPIIRTGPLRLDAYNVVAKTSVSMASVPAGSLDHAQISTDSARFGASIDWSGGTCNGNDFCWFVWDATTGAIQNSGNPYGNTGHAGFGILSTGTRVRVQRANLFATNPCPDAARRDSHGLWDWQADNTNNANITNVWCGASQSGNYDNHYSMGQNYPSPLHYAVITDFTDQSSVTNVLTSGALNANWDSSWKYLINTVTWFDVDNPSSDPDDAPNGIALVHSRVWGNDGRDCHACANFSADGQYFVYRSHLSRPLSDNARYIIRAGPLFTTGSVPTLTSVTPNNDVQGATPAITLAGTNLNGANLVVSVSGTGVTPNGCVADSAIQISCTNFTIAADATLGARNVTVTTDDGTSGAQVFTVNAAVAAPTLSGISPTEGWHGAQITVVFTGTGLDGANPALNSSCGTVTFPSFVVDGATQITAQALIAPPPGSGTTCQFSVTTDAGTSETRTFTVRNPGPVGAPAIVTVAWTPEAVPVLTITNQDPAGDPFCATATQRDCIFETRLVVGGVVVQTIAADAFVNGTATVNFTAGPKYGSVTLTARFAARAFDGSIVESDLSAPVVIPKKPRPPAVRT